MTDTEIINQIMSVDPEKIRLIDGNARKITSREQAKAIRSLLRSVGIRCVSCTTDRYWSGGVTIVIYKPVNRLSWRGKPPVPIVDAVRRLRQIILAAFPGLEDRQYFDEPCSGDVCFRIHY